MQLDIDNLIQYMQTSKCDNVKYEFEKIIDGKKKTITIGIQIRDSNPVNKRVCKLGTK